MGGPSGAAAGKPAFIVPATMLRSRLNAANDNRAPIGLQMRRLVALIVIAALIAGVVLI